MRTLRWSFLLALTCALPFASAAGDGPKADAPRPAAGTASEADGPKAAAQRHRPDAVRCDAQAVVADPDPKGLNVRGAPRGEVVGRLPKDTEVGLAECRAGWVRIENAWHAEHDEREDWPAGWVHPSLLTTFLKTPEEYGPDTRPVLLKAPRKGAAGEAIRLDPAPAVALVGCSGRFLQVRLTWPGGRAKTGWLDSSDHCPSTVTTCP